MNLRFLTLKYDDDDIVIRKIYYNSPKKEHIVSMTHLVTSRRHAKQIIEDNQKRVSDEAISYPPITYIFWRWLQKEDYKNLKFIITALTAIVSITTAILFRGNS